MSEPVISARKYDYDWEVDGNGNVKMGDQLVIAKKGEYHWEFTSLLTVPLAECAIQLFSRWHTLHGPTPKASDCK